MIFAFTHPTRNIIGPNSICCFCVEGKLLIRQSSTITVTRRRRQISWEIQTKDIIQAMPHDAHPMGVLVSAMGTLSVFHPDANPALRGQDLYQSKQIRDKQIARILGKAPTIAAAAYLRMAGRSPVLPSNNLSYSENFLYMLDSLGNKAYTPNPRLARVLDVLFIPHAEHEMNCSTAAARHLASSGVDVYTALAGAVGALYGPLHGGENEVKAPFFHGNGSSILAQSADANRKDSNSPPPTQTPTQAAASSPTQAAASSSSGTPFSRTPSIQCKFRIRSTSNYAKME